MRRRDFLPAVAAAPVLLAQAQWACQAAGGSGRGGGRGRLRLRCLRRPFSCPSQRPHQARCDGGVFGRLGTLDEQCREAARLGIKGYDLINTPEAVGHPEKARADATDVSSRPPAPESGTGSISGRTTTGWRP